jgi:hypothetical protein
MTMNNSASIVLKTSRYNTFVVSIKEYILKENISLQLLAIIKLSWMKRHI